MDLVGYGKPLWGCRNFTGTYVQDKQGVSKCTREVVARNRSPREIGFGLLWGGYQETKVKLE